MLHSAELDPATDELTVYLQPDLLRGDPAAAGFHLVETERPLTVLLHEQDGVIALRLREMSGLEAEARTALERE